MNKTVYVLEEYRWVGYEEEGGSMYEYLFFDVFSWKDFLVFLETNGYKYNLNKHLVENNGMEVYKVTEKEIKF